MHISGIVLSGGKSSRMGTNKSLLLLHDKPVIMHIVEELQTISEEVYVITNDPQTYEFIGQPMLSDRYKNKGPLAGLETALYHVEADAYMIAACDMPFIDQQVYSYLLQQLDGYDAVVPIYDGQVHPLSGIYKKDVLRHIQHQLERNRLRVNSFFDYIHVKYVETYDDICEHVLHKHFFNMNHPDEYEQAKTL